MTGITHGFGMGAGFYVNATHKPYAQHHYMRDYIEHELPALVADKLRCRAKRLYQ